MDGIKRLKKKDKANYSRVLNMSLKKLKTHQTVIQNIFKKDSTILFSFACEASKHFSKLNKKLFGD